MFVVCPLPLNTFVVFLTVCEKQNLGIKLLMRYLICQQGWADQTRVTGVTTQKSIFQMSEKSIEH